MQVELKFITPDAEVRIGEAAAECYDRSLDDNACAGCHRAGSGERYVAEQQAEGAA